MTGALLGFACELNHFPESTGQWQGGSERGEEEEEWGGTTGC